MFIIILLTQLVLGLGQVWADKPAATPSTPTLLFMGDSLTEGYGVAKKKSYPQLIVDRLLKEGHKVKLINGSISGSTSASALSRLKWFLKVKPRAVVLALGANDALRGVKVSETFKNLERTIVFAKEKKIKVVLGGMMAPPNYGKKYTKEFRDMYKTLAKKHKLILVPFMLEKVAGEKTKNQSDGIHPNEAGHAQVADNVYPYVVQALEGK